MEQSFNLKIFKTYKALSMKEQGAFRLKFKKFLNLDGIISLCLEEQHLYVEFNPDILNINSFKNILKDVGFPLESNSVKLSSLNC